MTREQYDYSNMFWDDEILWENTKLPKKVKIIEDDIEFEYLSVDDMSDFINIKCKECPITLNKLRLKKIKTITKK